MAKTIPITVVATDRYYIPEKHVDYDKLEGLYHKTLFNDSLCNRCEYKVERISEHCLECEGLIGDFKFWKSEDIDDEPHVGVPLGHQKNLRKMLDGKKYEVEDRRAKGRKLHPEIEFNWKILHKYQKKAINALVEKGYGQLESPPRSGKTVMGTGVIIKIGRKALILVHQEDLAQQFLETFRKQATKKDPLWFTNIADLEKFEGRELVGIARTYEQFKKYDIAVATYQTFLQKKGQKLLKRIRRMFGVVMVDEVHRGGASGYAKVINSFESKNRFGLSGTIERKDGRHVLPRYIIGPVTYKTEVETMAPSVHVIQTGFKSTQNYNLWTYAMRALEKDSNREKLIVKRALRMMKMDGGRSILIPVTFVDQAIRIRDKINRAVGKNIAVEFTGRQSKTKRRDVILDARKGKFKCVVAMRQLLTGVNVPIWSGLLEAMPMNNPPNFVQEFNRICTPCDGKPAPYVEFLIDDFQPSRACVTNMYDVLVKYSKDREAKKQKPLDFTEKGRDLISQHRKAKRAGYRGRGAGDDEIDDKPHRSNYD